MAEAIKDAKAVEMVNLTIDGRETSVTRGTSVLEAAKALGIHIPTFCWHPKLKSVGSCRMCYVEIEKMGKLQVSCATQATEGMIVHTDTDLVRQGRRAIIEFTLMNHPLDCPTCDKGGECDLQDLTFAHGIDQSRYDFQKFRFVGEDDKPTTFDDKKIGPEIVLNRNRCILCYRCVRSNREAFGEYDLGVYERGNAAFIDSAPGEEVDNPFSGNLVEICPVGALTNSDWRYKIRVWLTQSHSSLCNFNASGVNTILFTEPNKNMIYRATSRCNDDIDDGWISDVTRYGYQIAVAPDRLKTPLIKREGKQVAATWEEALALIKDRFCDIRDKKGNVCLGGLIAPSLDNASLYSFSKFFRKVLKSNNIDYRTHYRMLPRSADSDFIRLSNQPFKIADIDTSDLIVVFGSDLTREHQNEYLRIRKAVNFHEAKVFSINPYATKAADVANVEAVYNIGADEAMINAICLSAIEQELVDGADFKAKVTSESSADLAAQCGVDPDSIAMIARGLADARRVTLIAGELVARSISRDSISAALLNLQRLFNIDSKGQAAVLPRYANSRGAEQLGLSPYPSAATKNELASIWGEFPEKEPLNADAMFAQMKKEELSGLFIMGANPVMLYPDRDFAREGLEKVEFLVACDLFETETTALADVVLPLSSWAEYDGDYVNLEGRKQRATKAIRPIGESRPGYDIVQQLSALFGEKLFESDSTRDDEIDRLIKLGNNGTRQSGFLEVSPVAVDTDPEYPYPLVIADDAHHTGHLTEKSPSLTSFVGEAYIEMSPDLARRYKIAEGEPVRVESQVGKVIVAARISEQIENDVVIIPRNFSSTPVTSLLMRKRRVDWVKISKVDS